METASGLTGAPPVVAQLPVVEEAEVESPLSSQASGPEDDDIVDLTSGALPVARRLDMDAASAVVRTAAASSTADAVAQTGEPESDEDVGEVPMRPSPAYVKRQQRLRRARQPNVVRRHQAVLRTPDTLGMRRRHGGSASTKRGGGRRQPRRRRGRRAASASPRPGGRRRSHRRRPEWNGDKHDLSVYRLSAKELAERHRMFSSPNNVLRHMGRARAVAMRRRQLNDAVQHGVLKRVSKKEERKKLVAKAHKYAERVREQQLSSAPASAPKPQVASSGTVTTGTTAKSMPVQPLPQPQPTELPPTVQQGAPSVRFEAQSGPLDVTTPLSSMLRASSGGGNFSAAPSQGTSDAPAPPRVRTSFAFTPAKRTTEAPRKPLEVTSDALRLALEQMQATTAAVAADVAGDTDDSEAEELHGAAVSPDAYAVYGDVARASMPTAETLLMRPHASPSPPPPSASATPPPLMFSSRDTPSTIVSLTKRLAESEAQLVRERAAREALEAHVAKLEVELRQLRSGIDSETRARHVAFAQAELTAEEAARRQWAVSDLQRTPTITGDLERQRRVLAPEQQQHQADEAAPQYQHEVHEAALQFQHEVHEAAPQFQHGADEAVPQKATPEAVVAPGPPSVRKLTPSSASSAANLGPPRRVARGVIKWFASPKPAQPTVAAATPDMQRTPHATPSTEPRAGSSPMAAATPTARELQPPVPGASPYVGRPLTAMVRATPGSAQSSTSTAAAAAAGGVVLRLSTAAQATVNGGLPLDDSARRLTFAEDQPTSDATGYEFGTSYADASGVRLVVHPRRQVPHEAPKPSLYSPIPAARPQLPVAAAE